MILLKSKPLARQTRTFIRDNITTVINKQQLKHRLNIVPDVSLRVPWVPEAPSSLPCNTRASGTQGTLRAFAR